jgi:hypothetical protein
MTQGLYLNDSQIRVNLPNGDMVGHTGDFKATVVACAAADKAVKVYLSCFKMQRCSFVFDVVFQTLLEIFKSEMPKGYSYCLLHFGACF